MLLQLLVLLAGPCSAVEEFSFIHTSDQHLPYSNTEDVMREAKGLGPVELAPYGITAPAPSFVISTGDCTEFGGGSGWWEEYVGIFEEIGLPHYHVAGNHDNTWDSIRPRLTELYGAPHYSFDYGGVHFVGLDSASPQDPRPSFGREELLWLEEDLKAVDPATPVIVFYHHPPTREFASVYGRYRLYDLLRGHNVRVILVGHGHAFTQQEEEGFDIVMGGSTFGGNAGFGIVDIRDGKLRIAYRKSGQATATEAVFETDLDDAPTYPQVSMTSPQPGSVQRGTVRFEGTVTGDFTAAQVVLDNEEIVPLKLEGGAFRGELELTEGLAGGHWFRVGFRGPNGATAWKSGDFIADSHAQVSCAWRTLLGGSTKSTPAVWGELLVVGANDGKVYGLSREDGRVRWAAETGGDVLGGPVVGGQNAYVGSGDGKLYEIAQAGGVLRTFDAGAPISSSPALTDEAVLIATTAGTVHAVSRESFQELWKSEAPEYAIEDTLFVAGDVVCLGAWDTYVYALDVKTGEMKWRSAASGTREGPAKRYYSPADCGPVVGGGKLYVADRKYHLSIMDLETGELVGSREAVSGTGISEDGTAVYLRTTKAGIVKLNAVGEEVWTADVPTGSIAAAPVERDGVVYSVSNLGTLAAIDAATGQVRWSVKTLPGFYAMADPAAEGGTVYVAGMDGSVGAYEAR